MLKRKLVMTVLPLLTAGILVGSGFSAWVFDNDGTTSDEHTSSVEITGIDDNDTSVTFNDVTGLKLRLDQDGYENRADKAKGISFLNESNATVSVLEGSVSVDSGDYTAFDLTITITINQFLNPWIEVNSTSKFTFGGNEGSTFSENPTDTGVFKAQILNQTPGGTASFSLPLTSLIHYTIKPSNSFEWKNLSDTITNNVGSNPALTIKAEVSQHV